MYVDDIFCAGRQRMSWARVLFILSGLFLSAGAQAQAPAAPPLAPEGWSERVEGNQRLYNYPGKKGLIFVLTGAVPADNELNYRDVVKGMYSNSMMSNCPDITYKLTRQILDQKATKLVVGENNIVCVAIAGDYQGRGHMIYAIAPDDGTIDIADTAEKLMSRLMGLTESGQPTQYHIQIPTGPMSRKPSIQSSGNHGIWVALISQTVYDHNMGWRQELGTFYLVLTKGGHFMFSLPDNAGFTDAAAQAMMKDRPKEAGNYTRSGGVLTLRYADGSVAKARIDGGSYELDSSSYNPKRFFTDGTALSGAYSSTSITSTSVGFVVGERDFDFTLDGWFGFGRAVSMSTTAISSTGERKGRGGRYYIKDSAIHLAYDDGERSVLPIWQESEGGPIWFNGQMYKPVGR
jgi:hypothetical protein